jgi:aspartate oxidase
MNEHIMKKQSNYFCDILIIGGGSAGLRAAIKAHDAGANVLIVSKSKRGDPHTTLARGGINAALGTMDPEDNWIIHTADTLREGEFLADYERVEVLCKNALTVTAINTNIIITTTIARVDVTKVWVANNTSNNPPLFLFSRSSTISIHLS